MAGLLVAVVLLAANGFFVPAEFALIAARRAERDHPGGAQEALHRFAALYWLLPEGVDRQRV